MMVARPCDKLHFVSPARQGESLVAYALADGSVSKGPVLVADGCREAFWSADGSLLVALMHESVDIFRASPAAVGTSIPTAQPLASIRDLPSPSLVSISPAGGYVSVFYRTDKAAGGNVKNVKVFRCSDGQCVLELHQKQVTRESWPAVQFSPDDALAFYATSNTLHVLESRQGEGFVPSKRLGLPGGWAARLVASEPQQPSTAPSLPCRPGGVRGVPCSRQAAGGALHPRGQGRAGNGAAAGLLSVPGGRAGGKQPPSAASRLFLAS